MNLAWNALDSLDLLREPVLNPFRAQLAASSSLSTILTLPPLEAYAGGTRWPSVPAPITATCWLVRSFGALQAIMVSWVAVLI